MTPEQIQKHVDTLFSSMAALCGEGWAGTDLGHMGSGYNLLAQLSEAKTHAVVYVYTDATRNQVIETVALKRGRLTVEAHRIRKPTPEETSTARIGERHSNEFRTADVPQQGGS